MTHCDGQYDISEHLGAHSILVTRVVSTWTQRHTDVHIHTCLPLSFVTKYIFSVPVVVPGRTFSKRS